MSDDNVVDLEEVAKREYEERRDAAVQRAKALSSLMLGERIQMGDGAEVMAVPGGWIFYRTHKASVDGTFVPNPAPAPKTKSSIITPEILK